MTPTIPTTQLFEIPESYSKTFRHTDFLVVDKYITRRQRVLLFASTDQLKMLLSAETVLMDGTFSSCPKIFDQVYTLHSIRYEQCKWTVLLPSIYSPRLSGSISVSLCLWSIAESSLGNVPVLVCRVEIHCCANESSFWTENDNEWFRTCFDECCQGRSRCHAFAVETVNIRAFIY